MFSLRRSALAMAVVEALLASGATVAATTHYAELKTFAQEHPLVSNASVAFDVKTLRPTYRLEIGLPGKSQAFAIAERLGLPERGAIGEHHLRVVRRLPLVRGSATWAARTPAFPPHQVALEK